MEPTRIAITGVGAVTPLGSGVDILLRRWLGAESAIACGIARCRDFDPVGFLTRRELRNTDRFAQLAAAACDEALAQAGWGEGAPCARDRIGCVIGTALGGMHAMEGEHSAFLDAGAPRVSPLGVTRLMPNAAAAILAIRYGWTGESFGLTAACAAGTQAIGAGMRMIRAGSADAAVVGGAEAHFTDLFEALFQVMGGTSPSGCARPFDRRRDGFVAGEGAGILVLEALDVARARGAVILGEAIGYGASTDAHHLAIPRPDARGAQTAMRRALDDAGIAAHQVAYVNAHGTSTRRNDEVEARAISETLGEEALKHVKISSLKSATGHLQGAAGAVEAVATLAALRAGLAPPTVGLEEPDEDCALPHVRGGASELDLACGAPFIGLSNSFGLGGHNATVALQAA
jgi:3-oxoacyl-[acyl-carrier-protein] synthase II